MAGRSVEVILRANAAQYKAEMFSAAAATESAMGRASRAASRHEALWKASATAVKVGALGIAGGVAVAAAASANFEARMANVQTLSKATRTEMLALRAGAMHAGTGFGYTANQVADAEAEMVKAGVSVRDMMGGGLKGTLALAAAGQLDVADATTIAASAMTQFKLKGKDMPHIADLLAAGADKALGSVQDLGYGLSQAGTQSHQMGLSIEDTVGTLAQFAQAGLIGERGGTTLKMMLLRLADPSAKAAKLMDQYGLSIYNANGQMKTMPEIAGNITKSFKDLAPAQRNAALGTIFGSRAIQAANILMAGGEKGNRKWIRSVNDQGFAAEQASGKLNSLKGDLQKLKASGENALIDLGSGSQSPLRGLVQNVTRDINALTKNGDLKRWGNEIGHDLQSIITAAGPLAKDVGGALKTVGDGVSHVVDGFNKLPKGMQSALVTGGALAYGAHKTGLDSLLGGIGGGKASMLGKVSGVTPVVVTNWPVGLGGKAGLTDGALVGGASRGGRVAGALDRGVRSPLTFAALEVGALTVHNIAPQRAFASGALAGAGIGGMIGGLPGAAAGTLIGGSASYLHSLQKNKPTAFDGQMNAPVSQADKLAKSYAALYAAQEKIRKADPKGFQDALKIPSQARTNADLMNQTLEKMHEITGKSVPELKAHALAMASSGKAIEHTGLMAQKSMYDLGGLADATGKAGISADATAKMFHSLPKFVQTKIETPGALQSKADIQALGKQFGLTPKQVKSIVTLVGARDAQNQTKATTKGLRTLNTTSAKPKVFADTDSAQGKIQGVTKGMRVLNTTSAKPKVFAQDNASGTISHIKGEINSIPHSRASTITVNHVTTYSTRGHPSAAAAARNPSLNKPAPPSANGSLYVGRVRAFADGGGYDDQGNYVPRVPQMRQGGGNVLWSEPETDWEAYISGKPGQRERNLSILSQAADRLGADVTRRYANGAIRVDRFANGGTKKGKKRKPLTHKQVRAADRAFNLAGGETTADVKSEFGDLRKAFHLGAKALRDMEHSALRLVKAYAKHEKALDADRDKLKSLKDARSEYAGTVTSAYTHDPFGNGLAGLKLQLQADQNDARSALGYSKILDKKHIGQGLQKALLASGDLNTLQQLSGLSGSQVATYSKLYASSTGATSALGNYAAADQYNKAIATQTRLVHAQEALIKKLTSKLDHLEAAVERGARKGTHDGTEGRKRDLHNRHKNGK